MKKILMSIMAFAAVAMTMTSCNKEEASVANNFNVTFEDSEVMNDMKTHFVGHQQYWDNGDQFYIMDEDGNIAYYHIDLDANPNYIFDRAIRGNFSETNGVLTSFYPTTIVYNNNPYEVRLPHTVYTNAGEIQWPLYAQGTLEDFEFYNICANVSFHLTGDVAIDSITITTDKYINGHQKVDLTYPTFLKYGTGTGTSRNTAMGHGLRTNTMKFRTPFQLTSEDQLVRMTIPAGTYNSFVVNFYANGKRYTKTNNATITFGTETYNNMNVVINEANMVDYTMGALNSQFNVAAESETPSYVVFSQGNLEYVSLPNQIWRFADNQWDFRGTSQKKVQDQYDRDLFSWGANGYYNGGRVVGNGIKVWGTNNTFPYSNATELTGSDEWGNNKIVNGGNRANSGWRTLTANEMTNLLNNYDHAMVNLGFVNKTGMVIFPDGVTPVADGTTLTKAEWNALVLDGCVFFLADSYRTAPNATANTGSIYWLNGVEGTNGCYLMVDKVNGPSIAAGAKNLGGFVRLVKDVQ